MENAKLDVGFAAAVIASSFILMGVMLKFVSQERQTAGEVRKAN